MGPTFNARTTPEDDKRLAALAKRWGESPSAVLRRAVQTVYESDIGAPVKHDPLPTEAELLRTLARLSRDGSVRATEILLRREDARKRVEDDVPIVERELPPRAPGDDPFADVDQLADARRKRTA